MPAIDWCFWFAISCTIQAVLPETGVNNFTTDWNSGVRLAALLDYCRPGLFPDWRELDPNDR